MTENINDTSKTEFDSVEDPKTCTELHQIRQLLFLRFQIKLMRKMLPLHQGKEKHQFQF